MSTSRAGGYPQKDYNFQHLVTVGGYVFPEPSEYNANTATLVDSGRNVKGYMIGAVIRDDVAKVSLKWKYLTVDEWASVNACFKESAEMPKPLPENPSFQEWRGISNRFRKRWPPLLAHTA